ncbi:MAG: hypothetical protein U9O94_10355 [Nanoarchaeota archaeon]|nr:hypothetical protein [Nanoarchaeota archaeon]
MKCQKASLFEQVRKKNGFFQTRAQGGLNSAILVAVIAAVIIVYILFLPTEDREELLEDGGREWSSDSSDDKIELLSESVGRLDSVGRVRDKDIPNIYIFESTNSKILDTLNPIYVRNGWFDDRTKSAKFAIEDLENTDNVVLSFSSFKRKGVLYIKLNGELVYEYALTSPNVEPIRLKKNMLKDDNELEFGVLGVGGKFWTTNEYSLEDVKIIGDISDVSRQESQNVFSLTETEYQNLEKAELRFVPYCSAVSNVGILDISINNRNVFSAIPVCDDIHNYYKQDVPLSIFSAGQNKIIFNTRKGSYAIEQTKISFTEKDAIETIYYFEVNETTFDDITDEKYDSFLRIEFVDDEETKKATLNMNDHHVSINTDEKSYDRNIDNWIEEGNNFIKITPRNTLEIVEIKVELDKN